MRGGTGRKVEAIRDCWEKDVATEVKPIPRTIVATPFAEVAVTIIDVVVVVDVGESVYSHVDDGLSELSTLRASALSYLKRAGRVGSSQPGVFVERTWSNSGPG